MHFADQYETWHLRTFCSFCGRSALTRVSVEWILLSDVLSLAGRVASDALPHTREL